MKIDVNVPDGARGVYRVETFSVSKEESDFTRMRSAFHRGEYVPAGRYKRLMRGGTVVMSNTPMEVETNQPIIRRAHGFVLINGLGLGMVLTAILTKPEVSRVLVIEKAQEVIDLVAPTFKSDPRFQIIQADALELVPQRGLPRINAAWHDIWDNVCSDNLTDMHALHRKYGRRSDWQGSWERARCEYLK